MKWWTCLMLALKPQHQYILFLSSCFCPTVSGPTKSILLWNISMEGMCLKSLMVFLGNTVQLCVFLSWSLQQLLPADKSICLINCWGGALYATGTFPLIYLLLISVSVKHFDNISNTSWKLECSSLRDTLPLRATELGTQIQADLVEVEMNPFVCTALAKVKMLCITSVHWT